MGTNVLMGTLRLQRVALLTVTILVRLGITTLAQTSSVGSIVTASLFTTIFPNKSPFYTYDSFITATKKFNAFGTMKDSTAQKREIAAFLAHCYHSTSGLKYIEQMDQSVNCDVTPPHDQYPCADGKKYYGRGPLQISWNYNYGPAGKAIGEDLLKDPDLVARNATVSFMTALWFWTTPQQTKPSCQAVMNGTYVPTAIDTIDKRVAGFGLTIDIINGGVECGTGAQDEGKKEAADRVTQYQNISKTLDVNPGGNLTCSSMQPF